jgi:hypothetical protein
VASTRLTARILWILPVIAVLVLFVWGLVDFLDIPTTTVREECFLVLVVGLTATVLGIRLGCGPLRRFGLGLLVVAYFGAHVIFLPMDAASSLGFLTLALLAVELRIVADRFVPLYEAPLEAEDRERIASALERSLIRVAAVSGIAFLGSTLAADLALAGTLPVTTIPTALVLAAALVGVILLLALWPLLERREA